MSKHKTAVAAVRAAGFSETTAMKQTKRVLQAAVKYQAQAILDTVNGTVSSKQLMSDIVGISSEQLFTLLNKIANNDKDYGSALKVIAPLVKQHGVILNTEEGAHVQVPILNVTVTKTEEVPIIEQVVLKEGSTEP